MDLQSLFLAPILRQEYLNAGRTGHTNDVWRIQTAQETVILRASREEGNFAGPFWVGCEALFGIDPRNTFAIEAVNTSLAAASPIPVPQVLRKGIADGRPYVIVEDLSGTTPKNFSPFTAETLEALGKALARIHSHRFDYYGQPAGPVSYALSTFQARIVETMHMLVAQFYAHDPQITAALEPLCTAALQSSPLEAGALVMIDLDAPQFLTDGEHLTALVDTDAYVVGPRELDFIGLEFVLEEPEGKAFARGYSSLLPIPDLSQVRPVYRYLYRLLKVYGNVELEALMTYPTLF